MPTFNQLVRTGRKTSKKKSTAPALQNAYFKYDGEFRTSLPLQKTAYRR